MDEAILEALGIAQEEAAGFIQAVSKVRRFGPTFRPFDGPTTNCENMQNELFDLLILAELSGLSLRVPEYYRQQKLIKLQRWSPRVAALAGAPFDA